MPYWLVNHLFKGLQTGLAESQVVDNQYYRISPIISWALNLSPPSWAIQIDNSRVPTIYTALVQNQNAVYWNAILYHGTQQYTSVTITQTPRNIVTKCPWYVKPCKNF